MADTRTWSLLSLSDGDRQYFGNDGYDDVFGVRYSYNERVHNSKKVETGHFGVVRDNDAFLGWGTIQRIIETLGVVEVKRCPTCAKTGFYPRATKKPEFRCDSCRSEFDEPVIEIAETRLYVAEFGDDWQTLTQPLPAAENQSLYVNRAYLHAIRELHTELWLERVTGTQI
jgi:putative restriction endonuclease